VFFTLNRDRPLTIEWNEPTSSHAVSEIPRQSDFAGRTKNYLVEGKLAVLGFDQGLELAAEAWSQEALATSSTRYYLRLPGQERSGATQ
jgi:hypothetical protein